MRKDCVVLPTAPEAKYEECGYCVPRRDSEVTVQQQSSLYESLKNKQLKENDVWYCVSEKWMSSLERYFRTRLDLDHPGQVDNTSFLFITNSVCEVGAAFFEDQDYVLVCEDLYGHILEWYGGGPHVPRKVYCARHSLDLKVDVRIKLLTVHPHPSPDDFNGVEEVSIGEGMHTPFNKFLSRVAKALGRSVSECALYECGSGEQYSKGICVGTSRTTTPLSDIVFYGQELKISLVSNDVMKEGSSSMSCDLSDLDDSPMDMDLDKNELMSWKSIEVNTSSSSSARGLVGLQNLGNTCFMNSSLQCLSNTVPLTRYFVSGVYKRDINKTNPLGTKGILATEYARLMKEIWGSKYSIGAVTPRDFKIRLGQFAPQFSGYSQQDSQELLAFLLDGLHEDLNRIKNKPYTETVEANGRPDRAVAEEAWRNHLLRNDSIVVDLFQAQLKNHLVCPACANISVTFDPYMYLSLPLPKEKTRCLMVTFFPFDPQLHPTRVAVELERHDSLKVMRQRLGEMFVADPETILLADVFNSRIYRPLDDSSTVKDVERNIVVNAYEVPGFKASEFHYSPSTYYATRSSETYKYVQLIFRRMKKSSYYDSKGSFMNFGVPLVLPADGSVTSKSLYDSVAERVGAVLAKTGVDSSSWTFPLSSLSTESDDCPFTLELGSPSSYYEREFVKLYYTDETLEQAMTKSSYLSPSKLCIFVDLTIHVPEKVIESHVVEHESAKILAGKSGKKTIDLIECLENFLVEEKLPQEDAWYCPKCKDFREATKKFDLWTVPPVLIIHLKRFRYSSYSRMKIDIHVQFPTEGLDLTPFVKGRNGGEKFVYDLYAVSNHSGGLYGGHYIAHSLNCDTGDWHTFNDSCVSRSRDELDDSSAYVLFYRRRT